jgi:hypothetical protein
LDPRRPIPLLPADACELLQRFIPVCRTQNYEARDKDLAASNNYTIGAKATYAFLPEGWKMFKRGTATLDISEIRFKYLDFTGHQGFQRHAGGRQLCARR